VLSLPTHSPLHASCLDVQTPRCLRTEDTKGLVGPNSTWRDVQFTKVRLLSQLYGLRPWYCALPQAAAVCEGTPDRALLTPQGRNAAIATGRRRLLDQLTQLMGGRRRMAAAASH
jgi:hypothetical protein